MESWRRTLAQFRDLFNNMAPSQRMTLVVVPLLVLAGLGLVMYMGVGAAEEPLLSGKVFSTDELKNAETALRRGGLQYRVEGQRILVPKSEVTRYNAALISRAGIPDSFGDELGKAFKDNALSSFIPDSQRKEQLEFYKVMEVVNMIKAIPDIEDARLVVNRPGKKGFSIESKPTAVLSIRPRGGPDLSGELVTGLRQVVAGAFGAALSDVTIVNNRTGVVPSVPSPDNPLNNGYLETVRSVTAQYHRNISEALKYIPNVIVTVNPEIDTMVQSREREQKYDAKPFAVKSSEETETDTATETGPGSEPGMTPNQPRSVRQQVTTKNQKQSEKSRTNVDNVPVGEKVIVRQTTGFTAKAVQVAVAIPRKYYRDVLVGRGADEADKAAFDAKIVQLKAETEKDVREKVAKLIPVPANGTATDSINVSSFEPLETVEAPVVVPMTTRLGEAASQWGGPVGLALFALWALWMLNRSMKRAPDGGAGVTAGKLPAGKAVGMAQAGDEDEEEQVQEPTKRDKLQTLVKDNPEMAAAVLSRWLSPPK